MNPDHELQQIHMEEQIEQTLRLIGSAQPRPGIENRIAARLAEAPLHNSVKAFSPARFAFASAAGILVCAGIVAGSVNHSHRILPVAPGMQLPANTSSGVGTASAAHVAPKPVTPPANGHARSVRKPGSGRFAIPPNALRPEGVAVPKSPLPQ